MNATPPPQLLNWAETIGELIGRSIVNQLRTNTSLGALLNARPQVARSSRAALPAARAAAGSAPTTVAPRRRGRPPGSKNKPRDPSTAAAPRATRRRREKESVEGYEAGATVDFRDGNRRGTGSILRVDEDAGLLRILDLGTDEVLDLPPSVVRVASAPKVVFRRRAASAQSVEAVEAEAEAPSSAEDAADPSPAPASASEEEAAPNGWAHAVAASAADAAGTSEDSEAPAPEADSAAATSSPDAASDSSER